jgi:RHS repeat-associated protein
VGDYFGIQKDTGLFSVFLHNGEFFLHEVDWEIPGRGFNWKFERKYRSGITFEGPLGHNWEFNYNRRLFVEPDGSVLRMDGYGRVDRYEFTGSAYLAPNGFYTRLNRNLDGTFVERDRRGTKVFYSRPDAQGIARMTELQDRHGNRMRFEHNAQGQLVRVLDTLGRPIVYRYNAQRRLSEIEDFIGRKVRFEYDRNGDLVAVTSPAVSGTPNGNDFPAGKTTRYRYSSGFPDERLNHNLLEIAAPNETAAGGPPRVRVEYDTNLFSPDWDRVLRQTIGGVNRSSVPAGGTISYEYQELATVAPSDFNSPVFQTTVTDRNGNRTEYQFNQLGNIVRIREFTNRRLRQSDPTFFETRYEYNKEGELLRQIHPEGNRLEYTYDDRNTDRFQQGNLLGETRRPDSKRGGDQSAIQITNTYEPIYNQVRTATEARGNDPAYVPQNGGTAASGRYTTGYIFDYQEGSNFAALAREVGVTELAMRSLLQRANIPMGLGDVNGDGRTDQIAGNVVKVMRPTVNLLTDSQMARIEGGTKQPVEETYAYNRVGQMTSRRDAEGNVTLYSYYPENDPDGDGRDLTPGASSEPSGYLKSEVRDATGAPERNSRTNPSPAEIERQLFYDRVGNVIGELNGRGVLTESVVNQLNQIVEITRAADVSEARRNPEEPNWAGCSDSALPECNRGMTAVGYRTRIFYDHNNNVVKREIENRDSNNQELAGDWTTQTFAYDILDNLIEERREVSESPREILVTRYRYDRNENRVLEISPMAIGPVMSVDETSFWDRVKQPVASLGGSLKIGFYLTLAVASDQHLARGQALGTMLFSPGRSAFTVGSSSQLAGPQPSSVVSSVYDERDLLFTSTRGGVTDQFRRLAAHAEIPELNSVPNSSDRSTFTSIYDLNRNLIASIDGADNTGDGQSERTVFLYDGFDRQVSVIDPIGNQSFTQYDPASHVVRVSRFGPLSGKSPTSNAAATVRQPLRLDEFRQPRLSHVENKYDELSRMLERNDRLFVYQGVAYRRAPVLRDGPLGRSDDGWVTTRYEYDRKNRLTFLIEDDLSTFRTFYDGADRVIREIDPEENETLTAYDDANNVVRVMSVEITQRDDVRAGRVPDLRETFTTINIYDSLNRLIRTTDNIGQTTRYSYDSRDNLVFTSDAQHSKDPADLITDPLGLFPSAPPSVRAALRGRPQSGWSEPNAGAHRGAPLQAQSATRINRPGNTIESFHDGMNRKIAEVRQLRVDGQGKNSIDTANPANPDGLIVIDYQWDLNSRLAAMADDGSLSGDQNTSIGVIEPSNPKGNVTRYRYDDLNRLKQEIFDDGTINDYAYDADDNPVRVIDENGSIIRNTYDGANRLVRRDITRAMSSTPHPAGGFKDLNLTWQVVGTTLQELEYDGLSRLTRSFDNNEPDDQQDDAGVTYAYDSLTRLLEEVQNGHAVSSRWMGDSNRVGLVYPNGRELEISFDRLDRLDQIRNPAVDYDYIGPGRVLERIYSNGVRLTYLDDLRQRDVGYDGLKRVVSHRHLRRDNNLVVGFDYDYDRANNKLSEVKQHVNRRRDHYAYDSIYRLIRFARQGEPEDTWQLNGVGNWVRRQTAPNQANNMSEYTSFAGVPQLHDDNGNLIDDGANRYQYDFANRLIRVTRKSADAATASHNYDAFNRRVSKTVANSGQLNRTTRYYLDGWQVIEENDESGKLLQQYVYGNYVDELLAKDRNRNNDETATGPGDERIFYHQNTLYSVFTLTDSAGNRVEGYEYDAYGNQIVLAPGSNGVVDFGRNHVLQQETVSAYDNYYTYTGREFDPESTLYYFRQRYMTSAQGRFTSRDKIGIWGDTSNHGNGYAYVRNNPTNLMDPSGLKVYLMREGPHGYIVVDVWDADCCEVIGAMRIDFSISKQWRSFLGAICSIVAWYGDVTLTFLDSVGDVASDIVESYNTTCEEDKNLLRWAKGQAEAVPMYNPLLYTHGSLILSSSFEDCSFEAW